MLVVYLGGYSRKQGKRSGEQHGTGAKPEEGAPPSRARGAQRGLAPGGRQDGWGSARGDSAQEHGSWDVTVHPHRPEQPQRPRLPAAPRAGWEQPPGVRDACGGTAPAFPGGGDCTRISWRNECREVLGRHRGHPPHVSGPCMSRKLTDATNPGTLGSTFAHLHSFGHKRWPVWQRVYAAPPHPSSQGPSTSPSRTGTGQCRGPSQARRERAGPEGGRRTGQKDAVPDPGSCPRGRGRALSRLSQARRPSCESRLDLGCRVKQLGLNPACHTSSPPLL